MLNILYESREFDDIEKYSLIYSPEIKTLKDLSDGEMITVNGFIKYEKDDGKEGDLVTILAILTEEGEAYAGQSVTFAKSLIQISELLKKDKFPIKKLSGVTKAGRDYIDCALDVAAYRSML